MLIEKLGKLKLWRKVLRIDFLSKPFSHAISVVQQIAMNYFPTLKIKFTLYLIDLLMASVIQPLLKLTLMWCNQNGSIVLMTADLFFGLLIIENQTDVINIKHINNM